MIPVPTIDELVAVRHIARDHAQAYTDAIKAQAEKYGIPRSALRRYVNAIADDKIGDLGEEQEALVALLRQAVEG